MEWYNLYVCPECGRVINSDDPLDICPYDLATLIEWTWEQARVFIEAYNRGDIDEDTLEHRIITQEVTQDIDDNPWSEVNRVELLFTADN